MTTRLCFKICPERARHRLQVSLVVMELLLVVRLIRLTCAGRTLIILLVCLMDHPEIANLLRVSMVT